MSSATDSLGGQPELTEDRLCRNSAFLSLALALLTVSLFVYILLLPLIKGEQPNVRPRPLPGSISIGVWVRFLAEKLSGFWIVSLVEGVWSVIQGDTSKRL